MLTCVQRHRNRLADRSPELEKTVDEAYQVVIAADASYETRRKLVCLVEDFGSAHEKFEVHGVNYEIMATCTLPSLKQHRDIS